MTHIVAGNIAPGFSLKALDNKQYSLNTLLERGPVVAAFFKISCPVCQFTFPFLERLYKRYGGDGVTFLGEGPGENCRASCRAQKNIAGAALPSRGSDSCQQTGMKLEKLGPVGPEEFGLRESNSRF